MKNFETGAFRRSAASALGLAQGKAADTENALLESAGKEPEPEALTQEQVQEMYLEAANANAESTMRGEAMAAVLEWAGSAPTSENLVILAGGLAEEGDDEEDEFADLASDYLELMAEAMVELGADADEVDDLVNLEDDKAGASVAADIIELTDGKDEDDLIGDFTLVGSPMLEAAKKTVIRNGEKVKVNRRIGRPKRMSAAQKAALKKARRKANTSSAKRKRKRSMTKRSKFGLK